MHPAAALVQGKFPAEVVEVVEFRGDTTLVVKPGRIVAICRLLRDDPQTSFKYLSMVTALDYHPQSPRFAVVYNLFPQEPQSANLKGLSGRRRPGH